MEEGKGLFFLLLQRTTLAPMGLGYRRVDLAEQNEKLFNSKQSLIAESEGGVFFLTGGLQTMSWGLN